MTRTYLLGAAELVAVMARDVWPPAARDPAGPDREPPQVGEPTPPPDEARPDDD